jgi:hypothetical protein
MWLAVVRLKWQLGVTKINIAAPNSNKPEMFIFEDLEVTPCIQHQRPSAFFKSPSLNF